MIWFSVTKILALFFIAMVLYWNLSEICFFIEKICLTREKQLLNQSSEKCKLLPNCDVLDPLRVLCRFLKLPNLISIKLQRTYCFSVCKNTLSKKTPVTIAVPSFWSQSKQKALFALCLEKDTGSWWQAGCDPSVCFCDKSQWCLGCLRRNIGSRGTEGTFPLSSAPGRCFWSAGSSSGLVTTGQSGTHLEHIQWRTLEMIEVSEIQRGVGSAEAVRPGERKA